MAYFPFTVTENSITILIDGSMNNIPRTHAGFPALSEHLKGKTHDADLILSLLDKREAMSRLTSGAVKVMGDTVFYKGEPLHNSLALKIVTMLEDGYDASPLAKFMDNVMQNPDDRSREQTFDFVDRWQAPLTDDGCFVAFKGVNDDYSSTRNNPDGTTVWNRPGDVVQKDRAECDNDPNQTCSRGLHVCASHYLDSFWTSKKVIAVKVNPRDVVAVPHDYKYSKMRVCEYAVLGDIEDERHRTRVETATIVRSTPSENRVDAAQPTTNQGFIVPDGYEATDDWPEEGDSVIKPGSLEVGVVMDQYELDVADDNEHPDHYVYEAGDLARNDAGDYIGTFVRFADGIECFVCKDGEEVKLRVVVEEEEYFCDECGDVIDEYTNLCDECEMEEWERDNAIDDDLDDAGEEPLTFMHEATGQVFTATQISTIVDDIGQRGFDREYGVPRTTVQEWLKAIRNANQ